MSNILNNTTSLQEVLEALQTKAAGGNGTDTSDATATSADILASKTAYVNGEKITGNIPTKVASDLSASGATVTVPAGYYENQTTKSVNTATQATPSISVNSNGLITASATQSAGYVSAGTKSGTKQLTTQAAKTVTPTKSEQTVVSANVYTTGAIKVAAIPSEYITTTDATATAADILSSKTAYVKGSKITGNIATKTANNLTVNGATVTVPSGYYATQATKSVSTATQATPSITINSSGLITATATQTAGYVTAGTKSATKQLAFQAAKTITPGTASQIAVSSGYYTGGNVTVVGDSNLVAGNIKKGTTIFGVSGNYEGSGGSSSDHSIEDALLMGTISGTYTNDRVTSLKAYAFATCSNINTVNFLACTSIGEYAFRSCWCLQSVNFPVCTDIGNAAFWICDILRTVSFPVCTNIGASAFYKCAFTSAYFPMCRTIGSQAFQDCRAQTASFPMCQTVRSSAFAQCSKLTSAYFGADIPSTSTTIQASIWNSAFASCSKLTNLTLYHPVVVTLANVNAFYSTPMSISTLTGSFGSIYVPGVLVNTYKLATNWATYADRITAIPGTEVTGDTTIEFTVAGVTYQAEQGMTWDAWISSDYNTAGFVWIEDWFGDPYPGLGNQIVYDASGKFVYPNDTIDADYGYTLKDSPF